MAITCITVNPGGPNPSVWPYCFVNSATYGFATAHLVDVGPEVRDVRPGELEVRRVEAPSVATKSPL